MTDPNEPGAKLITPANFWFWFGGIWLAVGVPFLAGGLYATWYELTIEERLERAGMVARGMVVSKELRRPSNADNPEHKVRFRFQTPDGATMKGEAAVDGETWDSLRERETVTVRFLADSPRQHRIPGQQSELLTMAAIFVGLGALVTLLGGFTLWRASSWRGFVRRVAREGFRADAEVLEVRQTNFRINLVPQWVIVYRYRDHNGIEHQGKSQSMAPEEAHRWKAGDRGEVRYGRDRPQRSVWVGRS
jgi:hypothetical protein